MTKIKFRYLEFVSKVPVVYLLRKGGVGIRPICDHCRLGRSWTSSVLIWWSSKVRQGHVSLLKQVTTPIVVHTLFLLVFFGMCLHVNLNTRTGTANKPICMFL